MPTLRVAVDVGGTFTDVFVLDEDTGACASPRSRRPRGPDGGDHGRRRAGRHRAGRRGAVLPRHDRRHERPDHPALPGRRHGRRPSGFRDVLEIRRGTKDDLWDAYKDVAPPYIRRRDRFEVTERIDYAGDVTDAAGRGRGARGRRAAQAARGEDGRRLLHQLLREPGERDPDARDPRGGAPGRLRLHLARDPARDLRARALQHDRRQRRALAAGVGLRRAPRAAPGGRRVRRATCCSCTPAAAS